jgi:hypothetical protein
LKRSPREHELAQDGGAFPVGRHVPLASHDDQRNALAELMSQVAADAFVRQFGAPSDRIELRRRQALMKNVEVIGRRHLPLLNGDWLRLPARTCFE